MDRTVREVLISWKITCDSNMCNLARHIDLLRQALIENNQEKSEEIYDFPLSLELGVSSIVASIHRTRVI